MNVLIIGRFYPEAFALHIAETLSAMGHHVRRFEPGRAWRSNIRPMFRRIEQFRATVYQTADAIPEIRSRRMRRLWQVAEGATLDLVIVCHDFLWPDEVAELKRRTKATVVMWFPDHLGNFGRAYFMTAPYDVLFFKDPYIVHELNGVLTPPVYYLPECFNPQKHRVRRADIPAEYQCDIATAGNLHSWRAAFYSHLDSYNVKLWGNPAPVWLKVGKLSGMHGGRSVLNDEKALAFLGAKIVVNNLHYAEIWGVNVRTFEAAGIGAFQMVNWRGGLEQLFEDGKELISFKSIIDLREKLANWLKRPEERAVIANAGKRRAHAEHTYELRLRLILDSVGGRAKGYPMPLI